jgi:ABC-type dipeptide/oligopeptide/nickel transport system permease component
MKKHSEDELQRLLEEGVKTNQFLPMSAQDKEEFDIYNRLFDVLKMEPDAGPSYYFSKKVTDALRSEIKLKDRKSYYISLASILFICVAGILGVMLFTDSLFDTGLIQIVLLGKWMFIFCLICLLIIQFADRKILQAKLDDHWR